MDISDQFLSENGFIRVSIFIRKTPTGSGSALFESLCTNCKMLRTSTIIFITEIMVEVLKMNLLLWYLRETAKMIMMRSCQALPPHGDIIQIIEDAHAKHIERA